MAKTNKYTSFNFNDIYEKKKVNTNPAAGKSASSSVSSQSSLSNSGKTILSNSRIHGHMLVLSRPTPKPITAPSPPPPPQPQIQPPTAIAADTRSDQNSSISLRPQGRTGSVPSISSPPPASPIQIKNKESPPSPKPDRFVPPHLRPGFVGREEKPGPEFHKPGSGFKTRDVGGLRHGQYGSSSPNRYGDDGRPKSGGGYERRMRGGGEMDPPEMSRPGSRGNRPSSTG